MKAECWSLQKSQNWQLVEHSIKKVIVKRKWHFALKRSSEYGLIICKARYVARGFGWKQGVDFDDFDGNEPEIERIDNEQVDEMIKTHLDLLNEQISNLMKLKK